MIMFRKVLLAGAGVYLVPLTAIAVGVVVTIVSILLQKRYTPYMKGGHKIMEAEIPSAKATDDGSGKEPVWKVFKETLVCGLITAIFVGMAGDISAAILFSPFTIGFFINDVLQLCKWKKQKLTKLLITVGEDADKYGYKDEYTVSVDKDEADAILEHGVVYQRMHEPIPEELTECAADHLEVVAMLCVLGTYVTGALSLVVNDGLRPSERYVALDLLIFMVAVGLTLFPMLASEKYVYDEKEGLSGDERLPWKSVLMVAVRLKVSQVKAIVDDDEEVTNASNPMHAADESSDDESN